jgi:sRNA-binding carbon storage regulator CsrA
MGTQQGTKKNEVEIRINSPRSLRISPKNIEEKSNKFKEQNKKHEEHLPFAGKDSFIQKSRRYAQRKHRLPCSFAPTDSRFEMNVQNE